MSAWLTLGSLFDGIGGFPLAGVRQGITPVWASEIEAFPIEVTKLRFPDMLHVGDITRLKGAGLPPVDVVCGGSPCQDLSLAGKRAGLAGEHSGLFLEQIRVIKEMRARDKANGRTADAVRPRYMVWENVPGAFSSADGEDFRSVLEETCRIADSSVSVPRPPGGIWLPAGAIMGEEFSVAWRLLDAQYWGLAQRRKRIFLVADFGGRTAPQILFKQDRLFGDSAPGEEARQGAAAAASKGAGDSGGHPAYSGGTGIEPGVLCLNDQGGDRMDVSMEVTGTLRAQMDGHPPLVLGCKEGSDEEPEPGESYCIAGNIIDRRDHNGGNGFGVQRGISYTLNTADRHCVISQQRSNEYLQNEVVSTQSVRQYKDATDLVRITSIAGLDCRNFAENEDLCGTLQSKTDGGYSLNNMHPVRIGKLIRRLTPLECERLMGFPDRWTDIPGASDSARYRALGNSVAIPCVEYILRGIAYFLRKFYEEQE